MSDDVRVVAYGDTNKGLYREINEDSLYVGDCIFAVADGMGGHAGGEVASATAILTLQDLDNSEFPEDPTEALSEAIHLANGEVLARAAEDPKLLDMGTTMTSVMVDGNDLHLAHVGDSRAYLLRGDVLEQITDDHTFVNQLIKEGRITPEEAAVHPQRSVITRAIGVSKTIQVDVLAEPIQLYPSDQILLCSDGLTGPVSEQTIADILSSEEDGNKACRRLIDAANAAGGPDNITVVLLRVAGHHAGATSSKQLLDKPYTDDSTTADLGHPAVIAAAAAATAVTNPSGLTSPAGTEEPFTPKQSWKKMVIGVVISVSVIAALSLGGYLIIKSQYYIGVDEDGTVGVYQGIPGDVAGVPFSRLVEGHGFNIDELPERLRQGISDGIPFTSKDEADEHIESVLLPALDENIRPPDAPQVQPTEEPTSTAPSQPDSEPSTVPSPPPSSSDDTDTSSNTDQ